MVEPLDNRVMAVHYHAIQGGLQFPPHPLTLAFLTSHNIAPCQLTPNGHRFITCFITRCREVKIAPSLSLLLHVFHVNQSGPFLHLQPISGYSFVTSLPSLVKNWKEKFVYVSSTLGQPDMASAPPGFNSLFPSRRLLTRAWTETDPLLVNQLSDDPPLCECSLPSFPFFFFSSRVPRSPCLQYTSMLRVYNTRGKPPPMRLHTQSDDEESSVGVMADPTMDGVESGAIFSPSRAAPPVITINNPARVDRPSGPPGSPSIEYDPHDPLFVRGHSGTSRPRPLRPYHPDHIDFIRRGASMQAIGLQQRLQEASQDYAASEEALRELGQRHQQLQVTHEATLKELDALKTTLMEFDVLKTAHTDLQLAHSTLQGEHEEQQVAHTRALEHAIEDWQGTEDFSRAANDYACSRMPGLLRYWLSSPERSGQAMEWTVTAGGKSAMGPVAEVWLRDTDEGHARVVRECEAAFYLGQREMQDQLYGKLRRRFTSFSIVGWKLPEYLPLRRPLAPIMPTSTTTPADGFLMSLERAGGTSSVALPSDPVGGSDAVGSVDPSVSLHFTSGSGFSGSAEGSAAP
nr:protein Daple-like [Ipomoea batatas]